MSQEIVFDPIDYDAQAALEQFSAKISVNINGKKLTPRIESKFIKQRFSVFNSKYGKLTLNLDDSPNSIDLIDKVKLYHNELDLQKKVVFGRLDKTYVISDNITEPIDNGKPNNFKKFSLKLEDSWNYYYNDIALSEENCKIVREAFYKKENHSSLVLTFIEDGKEIKKSIKFSDIDTKKEVATKFHFRTIKNSENINAELISNIYGKITNLNEDEIIEEYGVPETRTFKSLEDIDSVYGGQKGENCIIRLIFSPKKVWASKITKQNKRECGIQFICKEIDIFKIENPYDSRVTIKSKYGFRGNNSSSLSTNDHGDHEDLEDQGDQEDQGDSDNEDQDDLLVERKSAKPETVFNSVSSNKKSLKIDSESENEVEAAESEQEESESESEPEPEPEPEPVKKSKTKTIEKVTKSKTETKVEKPKTKKVIEEKIEVESDDSDDEPVVQKSKPIKKK